MLPRPRSLFRGLSSDQFCAKTPQKDTCHGDSGGPIQIELSDVNKAIPFLAGVTSFGTGCWDGSFGVYTKISSYVDWIASNVNVTVDPMGENCRIIVSEKFNITLFPQNVPASRSVCRLASSPTVGYPLRTTLPSSGLNYAAEDRASSSAVER